jgi:hypothetical protein
MSDTYDTVSLRRFLVLAMLSDGNSLDRKKSGLGHAPFLIKMLTSTQNHSSDVNLFKWFNYYSSGRL